MTASPDGLRRRGLRGAGAVSAGGRVVRRRHGHQDHDLRHRRAQPRAAGGAPGWCASGRRRSSASAPMRRCCSPKSNPPGAVAAAGERRGRRRSTRWRWGALSLRTRGVYFIMVTLAFAQMAYYAVHDTPLGGGTDGIYLSQTRRNWARLDLGQPRTRSTSSRRLLAAVFVFWRCCCARGFGRGALASASTSSACAPPASPPIRTSWRPSRSGGIAGLGILFCGEGRLRQPRAAELARVAARC